ncbi:MAG: ABC transporter ATP-binding protein/permease [Clostridia bacterium]|nr:ABC transporter ATP-binding protein/permease [Clostridia bacterium]
MLQLKNIKKDYAAGENTVHALKGIDLCFRESEFVSILGQSGCGKTTMLNIIGGLDQYTEGDLIIDGKSTKDFKDRDWDAYRNHSVGFVFQTYNLIPHQSVLQNVELALTLSGVSKAERRQRAKQALEAVGLGDQFKKKPSEMSGGQMQRVAIARALVNNPDIILADEPTGALDTETSVQVMEILKEVSKDRLVIMVTHNPDLADQYSTRIIRMLDGVITDDSMPLTEEEMSAYKEEDAKKAAVKTKVKKPSMSFFTSFGLSLKNLFTKKGRTILTSFAGSIGIIGIALIFAVSQGTTTFIDELQEDTLTSYPLTIQATNVDLGVLMQTFMGVAAEGEIKHENDAVYSRAVLYKMINALNNMEESENDLKSFKAYIEKQLKNSESPLSQALSGVQYTYDFDLLVYTENVDGAIVHSDTQKLLSKILAENMSLDMEGMISAGEQMGFSADSPMMSMSPGGNGQLWTEMLSGKNGDPVSPLLKEQYDIVHGTWPNQYNEIVLVLDENNELEDLTLYALGLKTEEEINKIFKAVMNKEEVSTDQQKWSYEEICNMDFRVVLNSDCYKLNEKTGLYEDMRLTDAGMRYLYDNGFDLKVSGIIKPNEDATSTMLKGSIGYTNKLTQHIIAKSKEAEVIKAQQDKNTIDIFTGLPFKENSGSLTDEQKKAEFEKYIATLDEKGKAEAYVKIMSIPTKEYLDNAVAQAMTNVNREYMETTMVTALTQQMGVNETELREYIGKMTDDELTKLFKEMLAERVKMQYANGVKQQMAAMSTQQLAAALDMSVKGYTLEQFAVYYDEVLEFSESTYEENLRELGSVDIDTPASVNLFASSFENKDIIEETIADYNKSVEELKKISYTDYVGLMMSSITTIINAITYVLIAFVAISLIVSSIMIGVITLISVQERTKEIGILRAIGASKRNVSGMFNAETMIIGFTSGLLGVLLTYLLCIPVNAIVQGLTGINNLSAYLPLPVALILIVISVVLTLFAGIIPSRSAAKKDPVVALRTE